MPTMELMDVKLRRETMTEEDIYELTPEEEAILDEAEKDNVLISSEDFQREIQKWFTSRR